MSTYRTRDVGFLHEEQGDCACQQNTAQHHKRIAVREEERLPPNHAADGEDRAHIR